MQETITKMLCDLDGLNLQHDLVSLRPWGGFIVLKRSEENVKRFLQLYFPSYVEKVNYCQISPKILIVAPQQRLSLQSHNRRREFWKIIRGPVSAIYNSSLELSEFHTGDEVFIDVSQPHRLIGGTEYCGLVAEFWEHTDPANPSSEEDIVRLEDDYNRSLGVPLGTPHNPITP
jgi:mannose-6-phosphate isomerase